MKRFKVVFVSFGLTFGVMMTIFSSPLEALSNSKETNSSTVTSRLEALAKFTKTIGTIEKYYVDDVTIQDIIDKSIEGLMSNLDAHSSFLTKKRYRDLKVQTDGEFGGLGITIGMRDGALTVISPIEGTPADKAGLNQTFPSDALPLYLRLECPIQIQ